MKVLKLGLAGLNGRKGFAVRFQSLLTKCGIKRIETFRPKRMFRTKTVTAQSGIGADTYRH
jgi:hypothetical protein